MNQATCACGRTAQQGDGWCGDCGRHLGGVERRQPETVTVAQVLLVLSAVGAALGLLVTALVVSAVASFMDRLSGLGTLGGGAATGAEAGSTGAATSSLGLAVLETVVVVAVSIWAFRAVGAGRPVARHVLAGVAVVEALLTVATLSSLGASASVIGGGVLAGLLVFDAPVLVLLWAPMASRSWFAPAVPAVAAPATPAQNWAPPLPAPRSAPSVPFPQVHNVGRPPEEDPATEAFVLPNAEALSASSGRHSAREPQA